ncbi:universal stress protein [Halovenus sp. HT40]|uniref:universal stress protein n=1 Tax=Halovenus sp. HT40 TaxID=3126691 RepID=UPI00300E9C2A
MYDNILLPTDGSEGMDVVIEHARELAAVHDATLHTLYVANTASLSDLPMESSWEGVNSALHQQGKRAVQAVEESIGNLPVETGVVDGSPSKEIVSYAEDEGCDVIVMGTHGRSGVDRLLLGSVAERVIRSAPVPVMTVNVDQLD